jgi:hypothetical protein
MKQKKIAISLAIVGAIVAPFVSGTWKVEPRSEVLVPLTAEEKERIAARTDRTENCEFIKSFPKRYICQQDHENLERGAEIHSYLSLPKYFGINLATALSAYAVIFGLTFLVPILIHAIASLIRRYWLWLNT